MHHGVSLQIAVYERSRASLHTSKRGAGLGLDVNGQKALQAINSGKQNAG
jgi:hypothetical protein